MLFTGCGRCGGAGVHDWLRCSCCGCGCCWRVPPAAVLLNSGGGEIRAPPLRAALPSGNAPGTEALADRSGGVRGDLRMVAYREPSRGPCVCWEESADAQTKSGKIEDTGWIVDG